ncbi:MFS transporter [Nocardia sp. NPDC004604]|uniref:MFS transporter n=1 Tax=Nocardia sp. NPDC004604 TaxID=3157013 RepID=UPI00339EA34B
MTTRPHARAWPGHVRIFLGGQAVSLLGDGLALLVVPLLALELSSNPVVSGISAATVTIGYLCVGVPAGVVVDRFGPWRVLITMDALRAGLFAALYVLAATDLLTVPLLLGLGLLAGASHVFFETAVTVTVTELCADRDLLRANSVLEVSSQLALVLGPVTVGALAATVGLDTALLVDAVTFLVSLASLLAVWSHRSAAPPVVSPLRITDIWREFRDGLRYLLSIRILVMLTALQMVVNFGLAVEKMLFFYAKDTLGLTTSLVSVVVGAGGVGGLVGALTAPWLGYRLGHLRVFAGGVVFAGIATAAMSLAHTWAVLAAANAIYLWALVTASLVNRTQRQLMVRGDMLGRVTSTVKLLFLAVDPIGVFVAGSLTLALDGDPRFVFLGAGTLVTGAAIVAWYAGLRGYRRAAMSNLR